MPRTAKVKEHASKANPKPDLTVVATSNGPDKDESLFMMGRFLDYEKQIKAANALKRRTRSQAKLRGFNLKQFDMAIAEAERDDGTTLDNLKDFKKYCEFFDLPVGYQITLSENPAQIPTEDFLKKAYDDGYARGVKAKDPDWQAYPRITQEGESHQRGWDAGQKVNREKFVAFNAQVAEMERQEEKKAAKRDQVDATVEIIEGTLSRLDGPADDVEDIETTEE